MSLAQRLDERALLESKGKAALRHARCPLCRSHTLMESRPLLPASTRPDLEQFCTEQLNLSHACQIAIRCCSTSVQIGKLAGGVAHICYRWCHTVEVLSEVPKHAAGQLLPCHSLVQPCHSDEAATCFCTIAWLAILKSSPQSICKALPSLACTLCVACSHLPLQSIYLRVQLSQSALFNQRNFSQNAH